MSTSENVQPAFPRVDPSWSPGDVLQFATIHELVAFEDTMPKFLDELAESHWRLRPRLSEHLRPQSFNGRIGEFALTALWRPAETLVAANNILNISGRRSPPGSVLKDILSAKDGPGGRAIGFNYNAQISSSTGLSGIMSGLLVYATSNATLGNKLATVRNRDQTPYGLRRFITMPNIISNCDLNEAVTLSMTIAIMIERAGVSHPLSGGLPGISSK